MNGVVNGAPHRVSNGERESVPARLGKRCRRSNIAISEVRSLHAKLDWRILPFLLVCYTFANLDKINVGFAKLQMQSDLHFSDAVYGLGAGIFFLGYVIFEIPSNLLMPRIGARRTISRVMILWGLASASMMFVHDDTSFYVTRSRKSFLNAFRVSAFDFFMATRLCCSLRVRHRLIFVALESRPGIQR